MCDFMIAQTQIQIRIRDLDLLHDACNELGLTLQPDSDCRTFAGAVRKVPHVIKLKGPYDIAVDPSPAKDGTYCLTTEWRDGHVAREVGTGFGRLLQTYGVHATIREASLHGLRCTRRTRADGSILLTVVADSPGPAASSPTGKP